MVVALRRRRRDGTSQSITVDYGQQLATVPQHNAQSGTTPCCHCISPRTTTLYSRSVEYEYWKASPQLRRNLYTDTASLSLIPVHACTTHMHHTEHVSTCILDYYASSLPFSRGEIIKMTCLMLLTLTLSRLTHKTLQWSPATPLERQ